MYNFTHNLRVSILLYQLIMPLDRRNIIEHLIKGLFVGCYLLNFLVKNQSLPFTIVNMIPRTALEASCNFMEDTLIRFLLRKSLTR
jgi:predicted ABC-type exoprotein transport system permease subunit